MRIFASGWSENFDGPGRRLVFYCKGCVLDCVYCGNPESISPRPEILYHEERVRAVPPESICSKFPDGCRGCRSFACVKVHHHGAFEIAGETLGIAQLLRRVRQARPFLDGVTFGGGEPTMQADEVSEAVRLLREEEKIPVAMESNAATLAFREFPGKLDLLICDLKAGTREGYRAITRRDVGELVFENLRDAALRQEAFLIRIPLIPGYNTDDGERRAMIGFLRSLNAARKGGPLRVEVLKFHHMGDSKYRALGRRNPLELVEPPAEEFVEAFRNDLRKEQICVL
ncbi:MAG: radical SAM protein [Victivallaceae bacterium]|nr:radical SAM protein [Victivallaceae bacterium]